MARGGEYGPDKWRPEMLGEFSMETLSMKLDEVGAFVRLRNAHWVESIAGRDIPVDDDNLARLVGVDKPYWLTLKTTVMGRFTVTVTVSGSVLRHGRDYARAQEALRKYRSRKAASDKANAAKLHRDGDLHGNRNGNRDGERKDKDNLLSIDPRAKSGRGSSDPDWTTEQYHKELDRLRSVFGSKSQVMISYCNVAGGNTPEFNFVEVFKHARFRSAEHGEPALITMRSRNDAAKVANNRWLALVFPGVWVGTARGSAFAITPPSEVA